MTQPALKVRKLSKEYQIVPEDGHDGTFYELLSRSLRDPLHALRKLARPHDTAERFLALRDVDFDVGAGEVVGIIGRNGAGKSTLLKVLSRITAPTRGRIEVRGRLASLLEVGTGFHPELSGRENIFLNGAILGMSREEIARKFDEIVAFAEVDKFVDTPVKRYSSGMYVRLAFAVAAHLETDVLLVDEVLAVGDASFQRKSLGKMSDVARGGRTVLFVSHNLSAVRNLCARSMLFDGGSLHFDGATADALAIYEGKLTDSQGVLAPSHFDGPLSADLTFTELVCVQDDAIATVLDPQREFFIELRGVAQRDFPELDLNIALHKDGLHLTSCFDTPQAAPMSRGTFVSRFAIPGATLRPGRYTIGVGGVSGMGSWVWGGDVAVLDCSENMGPRAVHQVGVVGITYTAERIQ